jgi:hypothetical protein
MIVGAPRIKPMALAILEIPVQNCLGRIGETAPGVVKLAVFRLASA